MELSLVLEGVYWQLLDKTGGVPIGKEREGTIISVVIGRELSWLTTREETL